MRAWWAVLVLVAQPGFAQDVDCENAQTQMDMNLCAEQEWQAADAELNAVYKDARAAMQAIDADLPEAEQGAEENLRNAQRAWVTFRDAACAAEGYAMHGGSAEPLLIYGCRAALTTERVQGLQSLIESSGGG